jgi:hypothetical protein
MGKSEKKQQLAKAQARGFYLPVFAASELLHYGLHLGVFGAGASRSFFLYSLSLAAFTYWQYAGILSAVASNVSAVGPKGVKGTFGGQKLPKPPVPGSRQIDLFFLGVAVKLLSLASLHALVSPRAKRSERAKRASEARSGPERMSGPRA